MDYIQTTSALAREAEVTSPTVAMYADSGWLDHVRASNGTRLFRTGQADVVRKIYAERMANRGRRGSAA